MKNDEVKIKYYSFLSFALGYVMNVIILFLYLFLVRKGWLLNSSVGLQFIGCLVLGAGASYFLKDYSGSCSIFRSIAAGIAYQVGVYWFYGFIIADLLIYNSEKTISSLVMVLLTYMTFGIVMTALLTCGIKKEKTAIMIGISFLVTILIQFMLKLSLTYIGISIAAELCSLPYLNKALSTVKTGIRKYLERARKDGLLARACGVISELADTEIMMPFLPFMVFKGFRKDFL